MLLTDARFAWPKLRNRTYEWRWCSQRWRRPAQREEGINLINLLEPHCYWPPGGPCTTKPSWWGAPARHIKAADIPAH